MSDPTPPTPDPTASAREWVALPGNEAHQSVIEQLASEQSRHAFWGRPKTSEAHRIARRVLTDAPALLARLEEAEGLLRSVLAMCDPHDSQGVDLCMRAMSFLASSTPRAEGPNRG